MTDAVSIGGTPPTAPAGDRILAWALMALFSVLMGAVLTRGLAFHQPRQAEIDWGGARWLTLQNEHPKLYLRRVFVIGGEPRSAMLKVAATERFDVLLNGVAIGGQDVIATRTADSFDVTRMLRPGLNVIAIEVTRQSRRLGTQAIATLDWLEGGQPRRLVSDAQWRAELRQQVNAGGTVHWPTLAFDDTRWPQAIEIDPGEVAVRLQPDSLDPALLSPGPVSHWIWHADIQSGVAAFRRDLSLQTPWVRAGWLGISIDGAYTLAINGTVFGPVSGSDRRMDVLDIAPYLRRGDNRIEIQVSGARPPARLAAIGRVMTATGPVDFGSDESWRLAPGERPASVLASSDKAPPALAVLREPPGQAWKRQVMLRWSFWSAMVGAAVLALSLWALGGALSRPDCWMRAARPWAAGALWITVVLIADQDTRLHLQPLFAFWLPASTLALVALVAMLSPVRGNQSEGASSGASDDGEGVRSGVGAA